MARLPDDVRLYAIGDVHGCVGLLERMLARIVDDADRRRSVDRRLLVFLGDYIDRGPQSRAVVDLLLDGLPAEFEPVFLMGNHEQMLTDGLADDEWFRQWRFNGADETLASYGLSSRQLAGDPLTARRWAREMIGARHLKFFDELRLTYELGDYLMVHAGVRPGVPLADQLPQDLLWIREPFLSSEEPFGRVIVHGHTPTREPVVRSNRICLDTGAFRSGCLTAARLEGDEVDFISVGS